jgi:hypothetical protein
MLELTLPPNGESQMLEVMLRVFVGQTSLDERASVNERGSYQGLDKSRFH